MPDFLLNQYVLILAGGAAGSLARFLVQGWLQQYTVANFPLGTLAVNVVGCFAIGALNMLLTGPFPVRPEVRLGILVGILGGFTTFSSFGWETFALAENGQPAMAAAYVTASLVLGMGAVWAGFRLAWRLYGI